MTFIFLALYTAMALWVKVHGVDFQNKYIKKYESHGSLFFIAFFIQIIIDSHAIVRSNTDRACVPFTSIPPVMTFCKPYGTTRTLALTQSTDHIQLSPVLLVPPILHPGMLLTNICR